MSAVNGTLIRYLGHQSYNKTSQIIKEHELWYDCSGGMSRNVEINATNDIAS